MERKCYDLKYIRGMDFYDYRDLAHYPWYIKLDKKNFPYLRIDYNPREGLSKISSLHEFKLYLNQYNWTSQPKFWKEIAKHAVSDLNRHATL